MEPQTPAPTAPESAPAQPETTAASSAAEQAIVSGDVSAYRAARFAERTGTPLPAAPASEDDAEPATPETPAPDAAPKPEEPRALSKRQQEANERTRQAVEQATADLRAENARLRAATAPPAPRSAPPPAAPARQKPTEDEIGTKYATYADFTEDLADWKFEQRQAAAVAEQQQAEQSRMEDARTRAHVEAWSKHADRWTAAKQADPERVAKLNPQILSLSPLGQLPAGQAPTLGNHVAEAVVMSDDPVSLIEILSDPAVELQLTKAYATSVGEFYRAIGRLESRQKAAPTPPKPVTSASPPPTTLGTKTTEPTDEADAAVANDDVAAYRAARLRQRVAALR